MDIAALSVLMKQSSYSQQIGIAVAKIAIDSAKVDSDALTKMMEQSVNPNLGVNLDIKT